MKPKSQMKLASSGCINLLGHGLQFSIKGLQVAENPWNNISCQGIQPLLEEPVLLPDKPGDSKRANIQVFINFDQSYNGGGNITCKGNLGGNEFFTTRIFQGQLPLRDLPVTFTYSVKSNGNSQMSLLLQSTSESDDKQASMHSFRQF
ncbi:cytosolic endo-beta-N-acetylglucosaminidase 2-like isoform X2 [Asparagus officinalis]|uniref:cytosolic endo-beta-N-acetylglucosaminidase 2-like isoform X2 n=1 Tax=Asparagus officinalis TaxID=4686 RepID=UPI00098E321D|nr:cytosolic endo-beta-N-acetylglucosaminidase 2-like isoform X2 [Asparagus officinalis]